VLWCVIILFNVHLFIVKLVKISFLFIICYCFFIFRWIMIIINTIWRNYVTVTPYANFLKTHLHLAPETGSRNIFFTVRLYTATFARVNRVLLTAENNKRPYLAFDAVHGDCVADVKIEVKLYACCWPRENAVFVWLCDMLYAYLWSPYVIGQTIIFLPCSFFLLSYGRPM